MALKSLDVFQVNPSYKLTTTVDALVRNRTLHPKVADVFRAPAGPDDALSIRSEIQAVAVWARQHAFGCLYFMYI